jgi:hypothetical protein
MLRGQFASLSRRAGRGLPSSFGQNVAHSGRADVGWRVGSWAQPRSVNAPLLTALTSVVVPLAKGPAAALRSARVSAAADASVATARTTGLKANGLLVDSRLLF